MKSQINIRASALLQNQLDALTETLGTSITETISIAIDRMYQQEIKTMIHNDIKVKANVESDNGYSANTFPIRVWLEMPVNGKTVMSRGAVITTKQPSIENARQFARHTAVTVQSKLYHWILDQGIANVTPKDANNKLPDLINEAVNDESDWLKAIDELDSVNE